MGQSTNGILAYGYDLGGEEGGWKIHGVGEYGELPELPWFDPEDEGGGDFMAAVEARLLAEVGGFTEEYPHGEAEEVRHAYFDRKRDAEQRLGVEVESYCSGDYPMWILTAKHITVYRGDCKTIDMAALAVEPEMNGWDEKLHAAVEALGITPLQERPQWLLVSYWG